MLKKILSDFRYSKILWAGLVLAVIIQDVVIRGAYNNYKIFRGVFWHTIHQMPLYVHYPEEYGDRNHYGILFSLLIAPFAVLPNKFGVTLWLIANALLLYWSIRQLPLPKRAIIIILLIAAHDLYTATAMQQFNISIIALLVFAFVFIHKGKDHWATLLIVLGILTKLYGVVGLAFFFFSKNKKRFIFSGIGWFILLLVVPVFYSSFEYVINQYQEWFLVLLDKNSGNMDNSHINLQNLSLLGFLQRTGIYNNNLVVIIIALILFVLPYLRLSQYKHINYRLMFLASVSLFLVLFSTGTENSTYIIGYVGIGLWYVASPNQNKRLKNILLVLAILASLSPTDLVPKHIKWDYVIHYSLRAVPPAMIWLVLVYEMCFLDYSKAPNQLEENQLLYEEN